MPDALPILLLDPDGMLTQLQLPARWEVHAFQSVDEVTAGLAYLEPEVVLTTLSTDGLAFCRTVLARDPTRPVVMAARSPGSADVMRAMRVGVRDVIDLDAKSANVGRALDVAYTWRKSLQKGIGVELERLRTDSAAYLVRVGELEERARELQLQLEAENALLAQNQRELESQRELALAAVREKSRFLSSLAGELDTPLEAIVGYAERLREMLDVEGGRREAEHIIGSGRSLMGIVEMVVALARLEAGLVNPLFEPVAVAAVLDQVQEHVARAARGGGVTVRVGDVAVDEVVSDAKRLREALVPIVDNAVKLTPGSTVTLSVRKEAGEPDGWIVFCVEDTGGGVAAEVLASLLQPFGSAPEASTREYGSAGLGLALAREVARVLGGQLDARSEPGRGTVFELRIPDAVQLAVSPATGADLTVLVVDDDPVLRRLLDRMLVADGHSVVATGSGSDALELARQHQPALILLDVTLPGMDGFEVLEGLQDDPAVSEIPVVMISADHVVDRAVHAGAREVLVKPIDRDAVRRVVAKHARQEASAGLVVVGAEIPACLHPLVEEGPIVRAVPSHLLGEALEKRPGAVVLPDTLDLSDLLLALAALDRSGVEVPVLGLVDALRDAERDYLATHLSGVVTVQGDPSARLRRYASAR
ncbi:MAG: response regulator [Alphaproteobacteria bacterium]|nr:response regulator [Alphaproteobacteria bacterium]